MMSMYPAETPVRLVNEDELRLSGLLWSEARQRLANSSFATVERNGRGQVILFAYNPTHRGLYPAMERLFLKAVCLGPGMATTQSVPWKHHPIVEALIVWAGVPNENSFSLRCNGL